MFTTKLSGQQLKERIGKGGKCCVALDGSTLAGTVSASIAERNDWYRRGQIAELELLGVVPQYKGKHIASLLMEWVEEFAAGNRLSAIELNTAETNRHAIEIYKQRGYRLVGYFSSPNADHYSVVMVKWLNGCPFSRLHTAVRFMLRKYHTRLRFKKRHIKRFGI